MLYLTFELFGIELDIDLVDLGHFPAAAAAHVVLAVSRSCHSSCHSSCFVVLGHEGVAGRRGFKEGLEGFDLAVGTARVVITGLVVLLLLLL